MFLSCFTKLVFNFWRKNPLLFCGNFCWNGFRHIFYRKIKWVENEITQLLDYQRVIHFFAF